MTARLKIAVACSGLGHVQRGIESWSDDVARALRRTGHDVTLFSGAVHPGSVGLPTWRRTGPVARGLATTVRHLGGWRYGMASPYEVEQTSFAFALWRRIRRDFDILHVQDPMIALWLERASRAGLSRPAVIYANGTGEKASMMRRFRYLQLLTPTAEAAWQPQRPAEQLVFMIPNLVDTERFTPGDQAAARARFGLPANRTIILCCSAIRRFHKRIDVLIDAFAQVVTHYPHDAMLVIAGGREADTGTLMTEGTSRLGERVRFLPDLPRDSMPDLYRAADAFVLASAYEMFGIVLLEALATGLPVLCNDTADFRGIVGAGGLYRDITTTAGLANGLVTLLDPNLRAALTARARSHVERSFSQSAVTERVTAMYKTVHAAAIHV